MRLPFGSKHKVLYQEYFRVTSGAACCDCYFNMIAPCSRCRSMSLNAPKAEDPKLGGKPLTPLPCNCAANEAPTSRLCTNSRVSMLDRQTKTEVISYTRKRRDNPSPIVIRVLAQEIGPIAGVVLPKAESANPRPGTLDRPCVGRIFAYLATACPGCVLLRARIAAIS
jgi:hypothetical protein